MIEIVKISLENEMDLVLTHKRTMKLSELCGLSLSAQTIFATAVSEISRCAISHDKRAFLILSIDSLNARRKYISASVFNTANLLNLTPDGIAYARKLMGDLQHFFKDGIHEIRINHVIPYSGTINNTKVDFFKTYFKNEPPVSPYDEIRKKNIQLIDLAEKLKKSEIRYKLLTDNMPLMMFALNNKIELDYFNKGLADYLGLADNETYLNWRAIIHPTDFTAVWQEWEKCMVSRTVYRGQARIREKQTGKHIWHLISIVPVKSEKDLSVSWIGFFADIHAQKLVEETLKDNKELKKAQNELREYQLKLESKIQELNISNRDLEQFAYVASHDLQEPLRKIKTFGSLLNRLLQMDEKQKSYFIKILSAVDRMAELITDVLDYSRLSRASLNFEPVDLNDIIRRVETDFELTIKEKGAIIKGNKLPVITGVEAQLMQLFSNLVSNSLKFSADKPVINIGYHEMDVDEVEGFGLQADNKYGCIIFSDNGIGFEQQFADQIFTIFQRLNNHQDFPGTGIGLALCKKIVENHRGHISAQSRVGQGATFTIILPLQTKDAYESVQVHVG